MRTPPAAVASTARPTFTQAQAASGRTAVPCCCFSVWTMPVSSESEFCRRLASTCLRLAQAEPFARRGRGDGPGWSPRGTVPVRCSLTVPEQFRVASAVVLFLESL